MPPHTIAWLYDSAANETIVYVNPTDHTLSIGNSGLLEIHLQGIATIEPSDFVPAPTTAPIVVAGESINLELAATAEIDATIVTTTAATLRSTGPAVTARSSPTGARSVRASDAGDSSGEPRTNLSEHTNGGAAITMASGEPIEPQHVQVTARTESHFVFNQAPVLNHGTGITGPNDDRAAPRLIEHGRTAEGDVRIALPHTTSESRF